MSKTAAKATPKNLIHAQDTLDAEIERDAKSTARPDQLTRITASAADLREAIGKVKRLEQEVLDAKAEQRRLEQDVLPNLMDEAGIVTLGLTDEDTLLREQEIYTSISKDSMTKAVVWLDAHGHGAIVKASIIIPIERGDTKQRDRIVSSLTKAKIPHALTQSIHPQTLAAFGREATADGTKLPKEITTHVQPVVHIKHAKKRKGA